MPLLEHLALPVATTLNAAGALYWLVALHRLIRTARTVPSLRAGLGVSLCEPAPAVCVVVPAHNEQGVIGALIASLRRQDYPRLHVVLCLDRCTDATASEARRAAANDPRFEIVEVAHCPEDWAGKVHALWTGAQRPWARSADLLLFADADTVFDPACVRAAVGLMQARDLAMLSLLSTLTARRWFERVVQPAAALELVRQYPLRRANRDRQRRAFANGQFILIRRDVYDALGGHDAVRDELLEDLALARRLALADHRVGVFPAAGLLTCRMYDSWSSFRTGWTRIYTEAAHRRIDRLHRWALTVLFSGCVAPLCAVVTLAAGPFLLAPEPGARPWAVMAVAATSLAAMTAFLAGAYRLGRLPMTWLWAYPLGACATGWLLARAAQDLARGVPIRWGGRVYVRMPRRAETHRISSTS